VVRDARDVNASIAIRPGKPSRGSVKDSPPSLRELEGFSTEPTYGQLDPVPIAVCRLTDDFGVTLLSNPPAFVRGSFDVEPAYVGTVCETARKHALR
jgi:hypothetical protein